MASAKTHLLGDVDDTLQFGEEEENDNKLKFSQLSKFEERVICFNWLITVLLLVNFKFWAWEKLFSFRIKIDDLDSIEILFVVITSAGLLTFKTLIKIISDKFLVMELMHPVVTFFHLAFRVSALIVYILCGWFSNSFISSFVVVVLLLSMDFWTVKNVTGRLMVGLRWWNYVDDEGKSHWVYETKKGSQQNRINSSEARIFWLGLVVVSLIWAVLFIVALLGFKFRWLLLVSIALALNGANLYGYIKCKVGSTEGSSSTFSNFSSNFVWQQLIKNATTSVIPKPQQPTSII